MKVYLYLSLDLQKPSTYAHSDKVQFSLPTYSLKSSCTEILLMIVQWQRIELHGSSSMHS